MLTINIIATKLHTVMETPKDKLIDSAAGTIILVCFHIFLLIIITKTRSPNGKKK